MKIISITGTKGKTTVTRAISFVLNKSREDVLRVDTDGHFVNERQKSDLDDSKKIFGLVPTVCPGKYLGEMKKYYPHFAAVLETAIGSSGSGGLGYGLHQIGIFTNVLEDHLGISKRLRSRMDIAKAKKFIFEKVDVGGTVLFNADDRYVCSQLKCIPDFRNAKLIPVGISFKYFDSKRHLLRGGELITVKNDKVIVVSKKAEKRVIDLRDVYWTFQGHYRPSVYNLMFVIGGVYAYREGEFTKQDKENLKKYRFDKFGGRLTLLSNKKGVKILVDYAHERFSLVEVASLAKKLKASPKNKTIGVIRLAPDRTNKMIFETGEAVADKFDNIIVYDKIDGISRKEYIGKKIDFSRKVGEVSEILERGIRNKLKKGPVERIIVEDSAIKKASQISHSGDVVVIIIGDDHKKTMNSIRKYFNAKFD